MSFCIVDSQQMGVLRRICTDRKVSATSAQNEFFKLFFSESSKNIVVSKIVARAQQFQFCMDESE